ncbi:unnamed protein product, partial [Mesorhabditis spiculigera]
MAANADEDRCALCPEPKEGTIVDPQRPARSDATEKKRGCRRPILETYKCLGLHVYVEEVDEPKREEVLTSLRMAACSRCTFRGTPLEALQKAWLEKQAEKEKRSKQKESKEKKTGSKEKKNKKRTKQSQEREKSHEKEKEEGKKEKKKVDKAGKEGEKKQGRRHEQKVKEKDEKKEEEDEKEEAKKEEEPFVYPATLYWDEVKEAKQEFVIQNTGLRRAFRVKCTDIKTYQFGPIYWLDRPGRSKSISVGRLAAPLKPDRIAVEYCEVDHTIKDAQQYFKDKGRKTKCLAIPTGR